MIAENAKLILSERELGFIQDTEWFLTKHTIIQKVYGLFSGQISVLNKLIKKEGDLLLPWVTSSHPKIYKGENYLMYPYVMMDYPASFGKKDIFAVRTMFWWGNFFSITLHLSGSFQQKFGASIVKNLQKKPGEFYVCINENQWLHEFEPNNYLPLKNTGTINTSVLMSKPFVKIALKYSLQEGNKMQDLLEEGYIKTLALLKN